MFETTRLTKENHHNSFIDLLTYSCRLELIYLKVDFLIFNAVCTVQLSLWR